MSGPKIKICGLRRPEDAAYVNEARRILGGPDFAGFIVNVPGSRRSVDEARLRELTALLDPEIAAVGVFVDEEPETVAGLLREGVIDACQLHGSEDADYIRRLRELVGEHSVGNDAAAQRKTKPPVIIKAFRLADGLTDELTEEIEHCPADLVLVDSGAGSGQTFDWSVLAEPEAGTKEENGTSAGRRRIRREFLLAGGLTPKNIPEAVRKARPWGIDVSSGVETDGTKDEAKIRAAVSAVRIAALP